MSTGMCDYRHGLLTVMLALRFNLLTILDYRPSVLTQNLSNSRL